VSAALIQRLGIVLEIASMEVAVDVMQLCRPVQVGATIFHRARPLPALPLAKT
jgi:hypothetical protein